VAGYSGTPLARKLGIAHDSRVAFPLDVVVAFFDGRAEIDRRFERLAGAVHPDGGLWIAWPKRASGVATDVTEDVVREIALAAGLVDNKVCAIDETWSGLRLVHRIENRRR
jgi:hypothetical protein